MVSNAAERMRRSRERRRDGVRSLRVEVHIDTVEMLVETDYLSVEDVGNFDAVSDALARFIGDSTDAVTCNEITLDGW